MKSRDDSAGPTLQRPLLYPLKCPVMDYAWGQSGKAAFILKLLEDAPASFLEDPAILASKPAAELWMGAHSKAPAQIDTPEGRQALDRELSIKAKHYLGPQLAEKGHRRLSFLFKILDARYPLSIQAHPDSQLAKKLHSQKPEHYPDPYHKPEFALCIKDMRALVGFRPIDEILTHLNRISVLAKLCKVSEYDNKTREDIYRFPETKAKVWLKKSYTALMQSTPDRLKEAAQVHLSEIERRRDLNKMNYMSEPDKADSLFALLAKHYGLQDPGIFCVYFLNYVELKPGEALFLGANNPHSYIHGVILECMAASDNVVRAGLSSKYCDIPTLLEMVHYRTGRPQILKPFKEKDSYSYNVPIKDFGICIYADPELTENQKISVKLRKTKGSKEFALRDLNRPSILLMLGEEAKGELIFYSKKEKKPIQRQSLTRGNVFFLPGDLEDRGIRLLLHISKAKLYRAFGPR